jgi:catechol 2,3-dioxygenase-like lactoylglutathione lyase family enzyme
VSDSFKTHAAGMPTVRRMETRFAVIELVVADMAKSLAFYRRLGLTIAADGDTQPHTEATLPGGLRMAWDTVDTVRSFDPEWTPAAGSSRVGLAFDCGTPSGIDRVYAELVEAGYQGHKQPWDAFWGQRYALVHDPDGNSVDLFASL